MLWPAQWQTPMTLDAPCPRDARSDAGIASARAAEASVGAARQLIAGPTIQPTYGRTAPDERRAGFLAIATIAARLSRTAGTASLPFGEYLRQVCVDLAATFGGPRGVTLTCAASDELLPVGPAITLGRLAEELVSNALAYGFPGGRRGRIAVSFTADAEAWKLRVEDSGIVVRTDSDRRDDGLLLARLLVLQLDGALDTEGGVIGGIRRTVAIPRPHPQA